VWGCAVGRVGVRGWPGGGAWLAGWGCAVGPVGLRRRLVWEAAGVLILVGACVLAAAAWVYLLCGHGGYWRTDCRLPRPSGRSVPARSGSETALDE
jgi:hypothetical protein